MAPEVTGDLGGPIQGESVGEYFTRCQKWVLEEYERSIQDTLFNEEYGIKVEDLCLPDGDHTP